jgi:trans-2,3-dihydro-3-hydroxyanthranilate isomerase
MRYQYYTSDVFTDTPFGGNQLAVIPDAGGLPADRMQQIAREFNYSETTFVLPPEDPVHFRRVRIFTPTCEIPFAGHPTVGTAFVLAATGEVPLADKAVTVVFEEGVGPVPVKIESENGTPGFIQFTTAQLTEFGPPPPSTAEIAAALGLDPTDIMTDSTQYSVQSASCGLPFLIVPLTGLDALGRIKANNTAWQALPKSPWTEFIFAFTDETESSRTNPSVSSDASSVSSDADFRARMFAPTVGVVEDPATGSAAAAFAGYLATHKAQSATLSWTIAQGVEMGRPSRIQIEVDRQDGEVSAIRVGGRSVMVMEGTIDVPL